MCRVLKLMTLTTIEFDSGFPLHISPDSPCDDNNADICPLLQWPARYPSGQCLHPACAGCAEPRTGPGHKELQVLAPRPSPQPVSAASQVRAAEPGEWERETGDSEDWGLGSGERAQCSARAQPAATCLGRPDGGAARPDPSLATERAPLSSAGHRTVRMAVLTDGQKFGLSSKSQTKKSVICVKLTDSALRSLEEYLKNKVSEIF